MEHPAKPSAAIRRRPRWSSTVTRLLDRVVGLEQQCLRNGDPEDFSRLEVDDQLELRWPLDGEIARLRTFQDLVHECRRAPMDLVDVRAIRHEAAGAWELTKAVQRGQALLRGQCHYFGLAALDDQRVA